MFVEVHLYPFLPNNQLTVPILQHTPKNKKRYELDAVSAKNITYNHWCSNHRNVSKRGLPANFIR